MARRGATPASIIFPSLVEGRGRKNLSEALPVFKRKEGRRRMYILHGVIPAKAGIQDCEVEYFPIYFSPKGGIICLF
jgi:hypothetical protein